MVFDHSDCFMCLYQTILLKYNKLRCIISIYFINILQDTHELQPLIDSLQIEALALKDFLHGGKIHNLTGYFEEIISSA